MKIFKKRTLMNILPVLAILFMIGCEDLIFPDPNNPTDETATLQSLVTGAEAGLRVDIGVYLRDLLVVGREAYYLEPADPRYTGELLRGPADPGGFLTMRPWTANYKVIKNCENMQAHSDADAGSNGFAKTIHAYCLMRILSLTDINGARLNYDGDISAAVATKAEVLAEIESLLDDGYSDLISAVDCDDDENGVQFCFTLSDGFSGFDTATNFGKFNRALRARVAVNQDDWDVALTALDNSFMDESGDLDDGVFHVFSSASNDQVNEMYEAADADYVKLMVHPSYAVDVEAGDTRYDDKITVRDATATITYDGLTSNLAPSIWSSTYDPIPIIRNEELILLKAEANIGNGGDGLTEINIVRAANGLADVGSGGLDQLLYEKRYSLLFEGQRLVDMRHYDKLDELPLDRTGLTDENGNPIPDDVIITFPIPETETPG